MKIRNEMMRRIIVDLFDSSRNSHARENREIPSPEAELTLLIFSEVCPNPLVYSTEELLCNFGRGLKMEQGLGSYQSRL